MVAKLWLAGSEGYDARILRELSKVVAENADLIERSWNEHFT